jgi:hypothetical protein
MTFRNLLQREADVAQAQVGYDYGGEPVFDRIPGRDEFNFLFDGLTLNLSGPAVRELQKNPSYADQICTHYSKALKHAAKEMRK